VAAHSQISHPPFPKASERAAGVKNIFSPRSECHQQHSINVADTQVQTSLPASLIIHCALVLYPSVLWRGPG
jgi:hypothetical protein